MMPEDELSTDTSRQQWVYRMRDVGDTSTDFERGGVARNDASQGLDVATWEVTLDQGAVLLSKEGGAPVKLFERGGIDNIGLAFDQNMRPVVSFAEGDMVVIWWFDPVQGAQVFTELAQGQSPRITLDDHRLQLVGSSDVILAYQRDQVLYYRQQRDRFAIERQIATGVTDVLDAIGMSTAWRLQYRFRPLTSDVLLADHKISLEYSDDGGYNWSNKRERSLGAEGEYFQRVRFNRLGSFRQRVVRISTSSPADTDLMGAVAYIEPTGG
ncbi:hypothetical protein [Xanthomonas citri]|uniref:hypothetical protein n=1 Tax=Xanthomonas citri TaxID=346 RepID=UPI000B5CE446|nr:hypothetical protein [Xanthomonas citri]ASL01759.1 hypothetical protein XcvCFBP7113P_16685 [Xanthomonas citri pv. vignicola]